MELILGHFIALIVCTLSLAFMDKGTEKPMYVLIGFNLGAIFIRLITGSF